MRVADTTAWGYGFRARSQIGLADLAAPRNDTCNEGAISRCNHAVPELLLGTDAVDVVAKSDRGPRGLDRCRNQKRHRRARAANGRDERGLVLFWSLEICKEAAEGSLILLFFMPDSLPSRGFP